MPGLKTVRKHLVLQLTNKSHFRTLKLRIVFYQGLKYSSIGLACFINHLRGPYCARPTARFNFFKQRIFFTAMITDLREFLQKFPFLMIALCHTDERFCFM